MTSTSVPGRPAPKPDLHSPQRLGKLLLGATLLALPYVLFSAFGGMSWFDDEGTLLVGFRSMLDGHRMYDEIYSLYGPLYNAVYGLLYVGLHVPLTHTAGRLMAASMWLAYTAGFAVFCHRLTQSAAAALVCYALLLFWLSILMSSPGHPEELCMLLLVAVLLLAGSVRRGCSASTLTGLGAAMAGLALVKINIGAYVGGAVVMVLLQATVPGTWRRVALPTVAAALLLMPPVVQSLLFDMEWARLYAVFAVLTVGAALLVSLNPPAGLSAEPPALRSGHWLVIAAAGGLAGLTIVGGMMLAGSSAGAMLGAVVLQNAHFVRNWYVPLQVGPYGLGAAALSLLAACAYVATGRQPRLQGRRDTGILMLKSGFTVLGAVMLAAPDQVFRLLVPFCWLIMAQPAMVHQGAPQPQPSLGRRAAGMVGALMSLYPFPVAGHQVSIGALLPVLMLPVLAHDVLLGLQDRAAIRRIPGHVAAALAGSVLMVVGTVATAARARAYWQDVPLGLPGTSLVRVDSDQAEDLQWITAQLRACTSSYSMPGMFSVALWTGHALPTALNINDTLAFILPAQQRDVVQALAGQPDLCVVYNPDYLQWFDRGQIGQDPPLLHYLLANFAPGAQRHGFIILKRRGVIF